MADAKRMERTGLAAASTGEAGIISGTPLVAEVRKRTTATVIMMAVPTKEAGTRIPVAGVIPAVDMAAEVTVVVVAVADTETRWKNGSSKNAIVTKMKICHL